MNGFALAAVGAIITVLAVFGIAVYFLSNGAIALGILALTAAVGMLIAIAGACSDNI